MPGLNKTSQQLVKELKAAKEYVNSKTEGYLETTKTASNLAFLYEKARNAVEFRDEHLVRQAAIERILRRRIFLNQQSEKIANLLAKELSWAKYLTNNSFGKNKIESVTNTIEKYKEVYKKYPSSFDQLIGLTACEIEETLSFNPINQILINYVSSTIFPRIDFDEADIPTKSIQIYIATERVFAKSNEILITHKLLRVLLPKWSDPEQLIQKLEEIKKQLNYPKGDIVKRKVIQMIAPFNLMREMFRNEFEYDKVFEDPDSVGKYATEILERKYAETKDKVIRASKRSIIYIFLTKMILAISIEIPFEIIFGEINYLVLLINILFPPSLMILFNSGVKLPNSRNTSMMTRKINEYLFLDEEKIIPEYIKTQKTENKTEKVFFYLFLTTSILIILGILWLLHLLGFNPISQLIFVFFLSVVSFFAFRVREISNDFQLPEASNESFWETLLDYIFLPIIKVGQLLSNQISKLNILSVIFDFIIEAPLKSFLELLEDWLHFVRVKKEEILS